MKYKLIVIIVAFLTASVQTNAQNVWGQILNGLVQGASQSIEVATLKKVLNNPNLQSADMKKYLTNYHNGDAFMKLGSYKNAAECYATAWLTASGTNDTYLKKLWVNYGWAQDTTAKLENAQSLAGISTYSSGSSISDGYVGGDYNSYSSGSSSSSASKSRVCSLCNGTGMKITEHYGAGQRKYCSTCGKTVSTGHMHVRCDMCKGTGTLNY